MPRLFHSTAALSAAAVLCLSPIAHGDEKGEALVRAAGERLTSAVPFFLSYKIVITKNGMIFEGSSSLMQVVGLRGGHGGGGSGPGISGASACRSTWATSRGSRARRARRISTCRSSR